MNWLFVSRFPKRCRASFVSRHSFLTSTARRRDSSKRNPRIVDYQVICTGFGLPRNADVPRHIAPEQTADLQCCRANKLFGPGHRFAQQASVDPEMTEARLCNLPSVCKLDRAG